MALLEQRAAIVTGAGRGIGRAIATAFAAAGAAVVAVDRDLDGAAETAQLIVDQGGQAIALDVDVRKEDSVQSMVERAIAAYPDLDILVNNAGIGGRQRPTIEQPLDHWQRVISVNLDGPFLCCKHLGPHLLALGHGSVINIASISGLIGHANGASYGPSKAAILNLTQQLAAEWGPRGIRVNAIAPGAITTEWMLDAFEAGRDQPGPRVSMTPLRRLGEPADIARVALFFASDLARFVTGQFLTVDGGLTTHLPYQ